MSSYTTDETFKNKDFSKVTINVTEFDNCTFTNCIFSKTDLSNITFIDCEFENCDLSLAKITQTVFNSVFFSNCKLIGVQFNTCNHFILTLNFKKCNLDLSSFFQMNLKGIKFDTCSLNEVDFVEANLSNQIFTDCDFKKAIFEHTNLEKANFLTAINYRFDLDLNSVKKAKFSKEGVLNLLEKYQIEIE